MVTKPALLLAAAVIAAFLPAAAQAQDPKVRLSLGGGTTAGAIDGEFEANVSVGYRFSKMFSFDVEVVAIDGATESYSIRPLNFVNLPGLNTLPDFPTDFSVNSDGDTLLSTVGFRFLIPTTDARFRPYVSGGLGVARTEDSFDVRILATDTRNRPTTAPTSLFADELSHTGVAGSGGVGAMIRVWKGLSLGVDARYYRLDRGRNLGTFGGSLSYGF